MNQTLFSDGQITVFTVFLAISVLVPIVIFVWYNMKKKAKLVSFFIGCLGLLLMLGARYVLDMFFVTMIGLGDYLNPQIHPVYTALYAAFINGFLMVLSSRLILRFAMDGREGRENALFMLIGKAGIYMVMYGAVTELTYMTVARTVNDLGMDKYLSSITDQSVRAAQKTAVEALAARPVAEVISEGLLQVVIYVLHIALGILIYMGVHKSKDVLSDAKLEAIKKEGRDLTWYDKRREGLMSLAVIVQVVGMLPLSFLQVGMLTDYAVILLCFDILFTSAVGFVCYTMYKQLK